MDTDGDNYHRLTPDLQLSQKLILWSEEMQWIRHAQAWFTIFWVPTCMLFQGLDSFGMGKDSNKYFENMSCDFIKSLAMK